MKLVPEAKFTQSLRKKFTLYKCTDLQDANVRLRELAPGGQREPRRGIHTT